MYRQQKFFSCPPDSALFVGLHRVRKCKDPPKGVPENPFEKSFGLKINDRVVWMSDSGPEHGVVKWIGLLPDCKSESDVTVGVEFVSTIILIT